MKKKKTDLQILQEERNRIIGELNEKIMILGKLSKLLYDALNDIHDSFNKIKNIPNKERLKYKKCEKIIINWKHQADTIEREYNGSMIKKTGAGVVGASVGVGIATLGPTTAMGLATTFGVTSSGTAISSLSGAAATKAALAWLGGGSLASGGGGIVAGKFLLSLAGPVGWSIAGIAFATSGVVMWRNRQNKKSVEYIYALVFKRDIKDYKLAYGDIEERITRIVDETKMLQDANLKIKEFGINYSEMNESQQYELGSYVNLMNSTTQLLVNPIKDLEPKFTENDFDDFIKSNCCYKMEHSKGPDEKDLQKYKNIIVSLANMLWEIKFDECNPKIFYRSLKHNKEYIETTKINKKEFTFNLFAYSLEARNYKERKNNK